MSSIEISTSIRSGRSDCALRAKPDILMTPRSSDRCYRAETREKPDYRKSGLSAVRERQKLFTCAVILAEAAQHHRGHHRRILFLHAAHHRAQEIGRASCRERVCQYV